MVLQRFGAQPLVGKVERMEIHSLELQPPHASEPVEGMVERMGNHSLGTQPPREGSGQSQCR